MRRTLCRSMLVGLVLLGGLIGQDAHAGSQDWGCVGKTKNGARITFNDRRLVILDADLASGVLRKSNPTPRIDSYHQSKMQDNAIVWEDEAQSKVILREKSSKLSKRSSESAPCGERGARDITYTLYQKSFELVQGQSSTPEVIKVECYEYQVTTCG